MNGHQNYRFSENTRTPKQKCARTKILSTWGNQVTMNLNPLILSNVESSPYFKWDLKEITTYHQLVDEIYYKVKHLEPWERGSRKTFDEMGIPSGGGCGVSVGGVISTTFCLLYKLHGMRLTRKQIMGIVHHPDSPYIKAVGLMYIRFTQPPTDLWDWFEPLFDCLEELTPGATSGGPAMTIGEIAQNFLTKWNWFGSPFPRIPVPVQLEIDQKLASLKQLTQNVPRMSSTSRSRSKNRSRSRSGSGSRSRSISREGQSETSRKSRKSNKPDHYKERDDRRHKKRQRTPTTSGSSPDQHQKSSDGRHHEESRPPQCHQT